MDYSLLVLMLIPAVGTLMPALLPDRYAGKGWGIAVSAATFLVVAYLTLNFDWTKGGYQFEFKGFELKALGLSVHYGLDSISMIMVILTAILHPIAITASFRSIRTRTREHYAWMNILQAAMMGVWASKDMLLFYMFYELSLIPLLFIVGVYGGSERRAAALRLFLYTFTGGVFTLAGLIYLGSQAGSFDMDVAIHWAQNNFNSTERLFVFFALMMGFGVKVPLFPLHTWLPLAHTEAPTAGSVDLAALVLKLGTYAMLRFALPIGIVGNPADYVPVVIHVIGVLCLIGIIYGALCSWRQTDIKKVIAYSSVSHLGFCVLGMISLNQIGLEGSVLYMVNHGLTSGAMFLIIGMIYNRYHTRDINELSGLARAMPKLAFFFVFFVMASVGLPGLNGFVSEFLTLLGTFTSERLGPVYAIIASSGIILGAVYLLRLTGKVLFGELHYPILTEDRETHETIHPKYVTGGDITGREIAVLTPLAVLCVVLGLFPSIVTKPIAPQVAAIAVRVPDPKAVTAPVVIADMP